MYHENYMILFSQKSIECILTVANSVHFVVMSREQFDDDLPIDKVVFGKKYIEQNFIRLCCGAQKQRRHQRWIQIYQSRRCRVDAGDSRFGEAFVEVFDGARRCEEDYRYTAQADMRAYWTYLIDSIQDHNIDGLLIGGSEGVRQRMSNEDP